MSTWVAEIVALLLSDGSVHTNFVLFTKFLYLMYIMYFLTMCIRCLWNKNEFCVEISVQSPVYHATVGVHATVGAHVTVGVHAQM